MESTAWQNVVVGQDTPVSPDASVPSDGGSVAMDTGAEKAVPFQFKTSPALSTATQNEGLAHETALSCPWESASLGCVQSWPSQMDGPPSAATQKTGLVHEIWLAAPQ